MYIFEENRLVKEARKRYAKRILIQLPNGLKYEGFHIARMLEDKTNAMVIVSGDPCYGACDIALSEAQQLKADLIVHYGHSPILQTTKIPVLYLEARSRVDVRKVVKKALPLLYDFKRVGLATVVQNEAKLRDAERVLEKAGKVVVIGKASGRVKYDGQVLGCDYTTVKAISDEVDGFLFIGGGNFHALGIALVTGKRVIIADPYTREAREIDALKKEILKQRWALICRAKESTKFGIIVGLKTKQRNLKLAKELKEQLNNVAKETIFICMREISNDRLMAFPDIEVFVNTACPRVAIDDAPKFEKPVLTPNEILVMLGKIAWDNYAKEDNP